MKAFRPGNVDLPVTQQTSTSHALLTLPDTLTELDLLLPPDPTILSQSMASGRDTTLLSNAYDLSIEYPRGLHDEEDPLSQFQNEDGEVLDFALDDSRSFSVERGRDAMSVNLDDEFGSIKGFNEDMDLGIDKRSALGEEDDGLGAGFGEGGFGDGDLDFGFGEDLPIAPIDNPENRTPPHEHPNIDFTNSLLHPEEAPQEAHEEEAQPIIAKLIRKRKLLVADSEIEISKKEYSQHLNDTSSIIKKQRFLPRHASLMTLLEARVQGRLAEHIFYPPSIHPDLRAMFNPEYIRRFGRDGKRKRGEELGMTPKKARIEVPAILEEQGFGDGGFGDFGQDSGFGEGFGELDFGERPPSAIPEERQRTSSPSVIDEQFPEEEEVPTSITGSMSHSTVVAAQLLQKELSPGATVTLDDLTEKAVVGGQVKREDAVKMFFECLVLASRDVIRVQQKSGFGEIRVQAKDALFKVAGSSQPILV